MKSDGAVLSSQVQLFTLSDFLEQQNIDQVDFLKMDCEGAEYDILFNTDQETFRKIKTISLEFHDRKKPNYSPNQLVRFLEANDFRIVHFKYDPDRLYRNVNYGKIVAVCK